MRHGVATKNAVFSKRCQSAPKFAERLFFFRYEWALALVMTLPSAGYYLNYCLQILGLPGLASQICTGFLILIAAYSMGALLLKRADEAILILALVFACCAISYFVFGNSRYLFGPGVMTLQSLVLSNIGKLFIFFLPPLFLFLLGVRVDDSMRLATPIAAGVVALQLIVFLLTSITGLYPIADDYMSYAYYAFLPLLVLGFSWSNLVIERALVVVGWGLVLVSGSRGAMVSVGVLAIAYLVLRLTGGRQDEKLVAGVTVAVIAICLINLESVVSSIVAFLSSIGFSSRSLMSLLSGSDSFFSGSGREAIYSAAVNQVSFTGLGLFGDRSVVGGISAVKFGGASISTDAYVHNWILELLVDFGWFFGAVLVFIVLLICLKGFSAARRTSNSSVYLAAAFSMSMIFGRYLISASLFGGSEFMLSLVFLLWCVQVDRRSRFGTTKKNLGVTSTSLASKFLSKGGVSG